MRILAFILIFPVIPLIVLAQTLTEPQSVGEAVNLAIVLKDAVQAQSWSVAICAGLLLVVAGIKRFALPRDGSKDKYVPALSATLGSAVGGLLSLSAGDDITNGVMGGGILGHAASGIYDAFVKPIKNRNKPASE